MNISKIDIHMKKKMGAIIGGAVMIVFMIFLIGMFLWGNSVDPIPLGLFDSFSSNSGCYHCMHHWCFNRQNKRNRWRRRR